MEYEVKKPLVVADGTYEGVIVEIEYRTEPYKYTDVIIEFNQGMRIKYGCPSNVTTESKLGRLLNMFGSTLKVGETVNDKQILIGKPCTFMVVNQEREGKKYARVVENSVKPRVTIAKEEV